MTVSLTTSDTLNGAQVNDSLNGGGTGVDLGSVITGSYAPVIDKASNTGARSIYLLHDAVNDPIVGLSAYLQQFGTGTGFSYGGADTAANDFSTMAGQGNTSDESAQAKNNGNGTSGGLWMDMDADVSATNQFDVNSRSALVKIFGNNGGAAGDGVDLAGAFLIAADAMVYDSGGETIPSAPEAGKVGRLADAATLGNNAHLRFRVYFPSAFATSGVVQWEVAFPYSFTS